VPLPTAHAHARRTWSLQASALHSGTHTGTGNRLIPKCRAWSLWLPVRFTWLSGRSSASALSSPESRLPNAKLVEGLRTSSALKSQLPESKVVALSVPLTSGSPSTLFGTDLPYWVLPYV